MEPYKPHIEWCDVHCFAWADEDLNCLDCDAPLDDPCGSPSRPHLYAIWSPRTCVDCGWSRG
jgi:hypothetical protein